MIVVFNRWPILVATVVTLLNAAKPVCVDDAYYLRLAREIAQHPFEPYGPPPRGFETIWGDRPQGAFTVLAPPVLPYYLALGMALFGDEPVSLKLSLFPLIWLFAVSVFHLARRFVPERPVDVLFLVGLSAAALPCWNLMLDLPALAFGLAGFALFANGLDGRRGWEFVASGVVLALAFETKYNAVGDLALVACWGFARREFRRTCLCLGVAIALVAAWECFVAGIYGESHFLYHSVRRFEAAGTDALGPTPISEKRAHLILPLIGTFGAVAPYLWLLLLNSGHRRYRGLLAVTLACALVLLLPAGMQEWQSDKGGSRRVSLAGIVFVTFGVLNLLALGAAVVFRPNRVLLLWVVLEILVAFWMSPFCAARRVVGGVVASTLLLCSVGRESVKPLAVGAGIWGVTLYSADRFEARVEPEAVAAIARDYPAERVWFRGHWGFADAGERAGWRVIYPGRSRLEVGDLFIDPDLNDRLAGQPVLFPADAVEVLEIRPFSSASPVRTIPDWYGGKIPFRRHSGASLTVTVFRVRAAFLVPPPGEVVTTSPTPRNTKP